MRALGLISCAVFALAAAVAVAVAQGGGDAPPPLVTVETIEPGPLPVTYEYAGRVAASREVEVRAQVGGIVLERTFDEGARVNQGDVLFRIDPKPYLAEVALAEAQLRQAAAQLSQAERQEVRARTLAERGATSTATLEDAASASELAAAAVAAAQARLQTATLSLEYATVHAPVSGITSLQQVPEGGLLNSGDLLTRISQLDPIYVNFSAADTESAAIRRLVDEGAASTGGNPLSVGIAFGDGSVYGQEGTVDFTSSSIDPQTGTILSRAVLPNPERMLLPGQFVRVTMSGLVLEDAIVIPAEALMQSAQGPFVYVIDEEGLAEVRPIKLGRELEGRVLVSSGLEKGDRIVTLGVIKVRPGAPVTVAEEPAVSPVAEAAAK